MANKTVDVSHVSEPTPSPGPFLAKVVGHFDTTYMGGLEVEILRNVGNSTSEGQVHQVQYMSPFYGVTNVDHIASDQYDYNNTQKSYGMWMVPPDTGSMVIVIFIDGDAKKGFWIGCVQDKYMNFMVPGIASTENVYKGKGRLPVAEYNNKMVKETTDPTKFKKPQHPFATILINSGLDKDDIRGLSSSSARRETPSMVFGISTPGPIDKRSGAKQGNIGKKEHEIKNAYVSRLGGSSFVMDDGDDKFLRKKAASAAGPEYVSPEQGEKGGDVSIPHNELIRIRTRSGHQILLHNSEDLIYISHGSGNSWIEMTANGKIDVYSKDSMSFHTGNDFNFVADRDINFKAGGEINMKSTGMTKINPAGNFEIKAANTNIDGGKINLNSGLANAANVPVRIPTKEPWAGHENLDPTLATPEKTKAVLTPPAKPTEPKLYKKYTTLTDTFNKVKGPEKKK